MAERDWERDLAFKRSNGITTRDGEMFDAGWAAAREVTDEMVERTAREMNSWCGPVPGDVPGFRPFARRALEAALGRGSS